MKHTLFNILSWFAVQPQRLVIAIVLISLALMAVTGVAVADCGPATGGPSYC